MRQRALTKRDKGKRHYFWFAVIILSVLTLSCQFLGLGEAEPTATAASAEEAVPTVEPVVDNSARLLGKEWILIAYGDALNPVVVEPGTRVSTVFNEDGSMTGSGGCNSYSSSYETNGENIDFGPAAVTAMACEVGMEQESAYFAALESASTYEFTDPGKPVTDRLLINYDSGKGYPEQLVFDAATTLADTTWILTSYGDPNDPTLTESGVVTTAIFSVDGTLNGSAGCNEYSAEYTLDGNMINIGTPTSTRMACERGMEQEQAYLAALELAERYQVGNGLLEITYADGAAVMRFSALDMPLENVRWVLTSIDGQPLPAGVQTTALFTSGLNGEESQVDGSAGCNSYFGPYSVEGNSLTAGPFGATQMMCPDEVMQVEQAFLSGLENAQSYRIILKQLIIETSNGSLTFYADRFSLEGPVWTLTLMGDKDNPRAPMEGANFTASFGRQFGMPSGLASGTTGCNDFTAVYYSNLEEIKVNLPGLLQNFCSDAMQEEEQAYFLGLNSAREYRILGNELQLFYDNQVLWQFWMAHSGRYSP
jgi:heat shock protein HslJ